MKMNKIYKLMVLVLGAAVLATGCIKETFPTNGATQDQVAQSGSALEALVGAIAVNMAYPYSAFGKSQNYGFDFGYPGLLCAMDACTGDVICTAGDEAAGYDWFWYWERGTMLGPTQGLCAFPWNTYYSFMKSCNDVIAMVDTSKELTDGAKLSLGSAKAIRACFYLDMARQFEALEVIDPAAKGKYDISKVKGLTVPIMDENTTEEKSRNNPRAKRDKMFEFIFDDLNDAEEMLEGISVKKTIPSLAVVYGLKARAYLWLGQFSESYKNVKTGQEAYLEAAKYARLAISASNATIMTEGEYLNATTGFNKATNSWMWYLPQTTEGVTNLVNYIAWRSGEATWGYGGKFVFEGVNTNFYNRMSSTDWRRKGFVGAEPEVWYKENKALTNLSEDDFLAVVPPYANMKFHPANGNTTTWQIGNVTDVPLMRVEEMYLIEAEATAQVDIEAGKNLLVAFMAHRDPKYSTEGLVNTVEAVVEEIIWQKRIELWGEGVVFYDFKRLELGINNGYSGTNVPTDSRVNVKGVAPWWNFCIPEEETYQNAALEGKNNPNPDGLIKLWTETE